MTQPLPSPHQLHQWQHNFLALNQSRLNNARELMSARQQRVLDLLPLLLHLNHHQLPGFVSHDTPCGIPHFTPSAQQLQALKEVGRGVQVPSGYANKQVLGLYLIGSLGSLAQSSISDLDCWLCHDENLDQHQLLRLTAKCQNIERWAREQGIELHIFPMKLSEFRNGQSRSVDGEDCGSSQHLLLLDEFYRSALWLAGCQPRWWLISERDEGRSQDTWAQYVRRHLVRDEHWLDFGQIDQIPAAEFVGAGLWQLNKGLSSPYKALLKLLLTHHYASQHPRIRPLCWDLKHALHQSDKPLSLPREQTDAYCLLLNRLCQQPQQQGDIARVQLLRRTFYYQARLPLSEIGSRQPNWRIRDWREQVALWGWDQHDVRELDQRPQWSVLRVSRERNALISEMLSSYRFLAAFSQQHATRLHIKPQDMQLLGNRLYAAFDARPGKILNINPGIRPALEQDKLSLRLLDHGPLLVSKTQQKKPTKEPVWQLMAGTWNKDISDSAQVVKQSPSLMELLYFCQFNGLLHAHTQFALYPTHNPLSRYELKELLALVRTQKTANADSDALLAPPSILHWQLVINAGVDPQHHLSRRGMQKISGRDDALGYSAIRENLIHTLDLLTVNSWGEWQMQRFRGPDAMADCLALLLRGYPQAKAQGQWPALTCHCHCASRASAIRKRVESLTHDLLQHVLEQPRSPYIFEAGERYYLYEQLPASTASRGKPAAFPSLIKAPDPLRLLALLQRPKRRFSPYKLDQTALVGSPLRLIFERPRPGQWQVFYWLKDEKLFFYLLDDKGALLHQQWPLDDAAQQLAHTLRFMRQLDQRWLQQPRPGKAKRRMPRAIQLFEIRRKSQSYDFLLQRRRLPDLNPERISLHAVIDEQQQPTLYCNDREYSVWQFGDDLFQRVAEVVRQLRAPGSDYPCYLSDLSLPANSDGSTPALISFLQHKQRLERQLNQTLQQFRDSDITLPETDNIRANEVEEQLEGQGPQRIDPATLTLADRSHQEYQEQNTDPDSAVTTGLNSNLKDNPENSQPTAAVNPGG